MRIRTEPDGFLKTGWKRTESEVPVCPGQKTDAGRPVSGKTYDGYDAYAFEKPQESAIVSIFTPCELLQEAGIHPYNVERIFPAIFLHLRQKEHFYSRRRIRAYPETLCSYHKTFIGAAQKKVLPKPKCIVYTNLTCDANLSDL